MFGKAPHGRIGSSAYLRRQVGACGHSYGQHPSFPTLKELLLRNPLHFRPGDFSGEGTFPQTEEIHDWANGRHFASEVSLFELPSVRGENCRIAPDDPEEPSRLWEQAHMGLGELSVLALELQAHRHDRPPSSSARVHACAVLHTHASHTSAVLALCATAAVGLPSVSHHLQCAHREVEAVALAAREATLKGCDLKDVATHMQHGLAFIHAAMAHLHELRSRHNPKLLSEGLLALLEALSVHAVELPHLVQQALTHECHGWKSRHDTNATDKSQLEQNNKERAGGMIEPAPLHGKPLVDDYTAVSVGATDLGDPMGNRRERSTPVSGPGFIAPGCQSAQGNDTGGNGSSSSGIGGTEQSHGQVPEPANGHAFR
jgi:hypothetical protein